MQVGRDIAWRGAIDNTIGPLHGVKLTVRHLDHMMILTNEDYSVKAYRLSLCIQRFFWGAEMNFPLLIGGREDPCLAFHIHLAL